MHPPWLKNTTGCSYAAVKLTLPDEPDLMFHATLGKKDGTSMGDGIRFMLMLAEDGQPEKLVAERTLADCKWIPFDVDLSPWHGKSVTLRMVSDAGLADNTNGDHSCWAELALLKKLRKLMYRLAK